jgi:hypothetical protein
MRVAGMCLIVAACLGPAPAWAGDGPVSVGLGGGLDASTYSSEGLFDYGPVLAGFLAWTGSYPRVYRLETQWTRLQHEPEVFCPHAGHSGSSPCSAEIVNFNAIQLGILWFEGSGGRGERYGGVSGGVHRMTEGDEPAEWSPMASVLFGTRFRVGGWSLSIEGGGELVIGGDTGFAVIPVRVFLGL